MLEDPWLQLVQQKEQEKNRDEDSSDGGGRQGSGSDGVED